MQVGSLLLKLYPIRQGLLL